MKPRIFVAGLFHETHTFLDETTALADFQLRRGEELLDCAGDSSPLGGALAVFQDFGWNLRLGPDFRATPSGTVEDAVVEAFWRDFSAAWEPDCDAIFLVLHGAMVSQSILDIEGEILGRIRDLPGAAELPIYGVYDLHANFSPAMAERADALVAYRENPHSDAREASVRAANLLARGLEAKVAPSMVFRPTQFVWAPTVVGTADDPMRSLEALSREIERDHAAVLAVSVNAGFAFADTPDTGVSFQLVTTDAPSAGPLLDKLADLAAELNPDPPPADANLAETIAKIQAEPVSGLTVLVEPSDNIGGGAPGDCTGLLRALVGAKIANAAICINDPAAVAQISAQEPAHRQKLAIGGKGSRFDPGPLELEVELISTSDGRFELEDKHSHLASMCGDRFEMGPCAVVRHGELQILLTSRKTAPFDLGQWRSQGVAPEELSVIAVKAAVAHRQAYDPITARSFTVDTPGPCRSDLSQFDYQHTGDRREAD